MLTNGEVGQLIAPIVEAAPEDVSGFIVIVFMTDQTTRIQSNAQGGVETVRDLLMKTAEWLDET